MDSSHWNLKKTLVLLASLAIVAADAFTPRELADFSFLYVVPVLASARLFRRTLPVVLFSLLMAGLRTLIQYQHGTLTATGPLAGLGLLVNVAICAAAALLVARLAFRPLPKLEQSWSLLVNRAADPMLIYDVNGRILEVNEAATAHLGYSREELLSMRMPDFAMEVMETGEMRKAVFQEILKNVAPGKPGIVRKIHQRKDGTEVPVESHLAYEAIGNTVVFISVVRNVAAHERENRRMTEMNVRLERELSHLRQAPGLLQHIMDSAGNMIYMKDREGRYTLCNLPAARAMGRDTPEDVLGRTAAELFPAGERGLFEEVELKVLAKPDRVLVAEEEKSVGNTQRHFSRSTAAYRDDHGEVAGVLAVIQDTTAIHDAEDALRRHGERMEFALAASNTGIWEWDMVTNRNFYSAIWRTMLGYRADEIENSQEAWVELTHPDDRAACEASIRRHISGQVPMHMAEHRLRGKDGQWRWILTCGKILQRAPDGTPLRMFGTHTDITENKKLTAEQFAQRNRLELAASASNIGVWEVDFPNGRLIWDERMHHLLGVPVEEFRGITADWENCLHPDDRAATVAEWMRHTREDNSYETQFRIIHQITGEIRHMQARAILLRDSSGQATHAIGVNWDVTADRLAAEDLRRAKDEAEASEKARSEFMAAMSHELRTPMNGLLGMAENLADTPLTDAQQEMLTVMRRSGGALLQLINDFLDFSRLEAGVMRFVPSAFQLREISQDALRLLEPQARNKKISLTCVVDPRLEEPLHGDAGRVLQIITNLVGNAVKFTQQGSVRLSFQLLSETRRHLTFRLEVRDTGIGIPLQLRTTLFAPFRQAEQSTHRKFGGTGLGLTISNQIAMAMGGRIQFESTEHKGTTFWLDLTLPRSRALPEFEADSLTGDTPPPEPGALRQFRPLNLLLVEDNDANQVVAATTLEHFGHKVTVAPNGLAALATLRGRRFDAVIMDCLMPELDGFETTRLIRAGVVSADNEDIPIIALTASGMPGDRERCLRAGMNGFTLKPLDRLALAEAMDACGLRLSRKPLAAPVVLSAEPASPSPAGREALAAESVLANPDDLSTADSSENSAGALQANPESPPVSAPVPEPGPPVLDPGKVAALRAMNAPDGGTVFQACADIILRETPVQMRELEASIAGGNLETVSKLSHNIAGTCSTVGAMGMHQIMRAIHAAARNGTDAILPDDFFQAQEEWHKLEAELIQLGTGENASV